MDAVQFLFNESYEAVQPIITAYIPKAVDILQNILYFVLFSQSRTAPSEA